MSKQNKLLIFVLTLGAFGIINTEMGVIGILPYIADHFHISVSKAGWLVSLFALTVSISGPTMPLLFSGVNRKKAMLLVLGIFVLGNIISIFTTNFAIAIIARVIPAIFHPIYFSAAFTMAANSVSKEDAPKAVSNVFIATWAFFPSMPVTERLSYGAQLSVLKKPITWLSIIAVLLLNSAVFGVYSYLAEYLKSVTNISGQLISFMLILFGGANILGNIIAGKLLTKNAIKTVVVFPFALGVVYIILFFIGQFTWPMAIMTLVWGIFAGIGTNINQYWISSAAPEAPDFANGLFLSSVNLGTTIGTAVGGLFISGMGTQYVVLVGILSLILSVLFILPRSYMQRPVSQLSK